MGMRQLPAIVSRLVADGVPADAEAACIASASLSEQRAVHARLAELPALVVAARLTNPATVIIEASTGGPGQVAAVSSGSTLRSRP